jgi:preprotein translocase subunit SecA
MLSKFIRLVGGDPNKREIERISTIVEQINALEPQFEALGDEALRAKTDEFRQRLADGETLDDLLPEAFAAVREASKRTLGLRHYDVQMIGGMVLHSGKISEMRTGEGKTLVATLPVYLNALEGKGVHLITVNDYLARRDARWMGQVYNFLGMQVGVLQMAAVTENGKKAFLVDAGRESPREDQHQLRQVDRAEAYAADITYGTNAEFGFDYLRDNMVYRLGDKVQRGHHFAIVDEVDNVLIDEARTPLIISGPAQGDLEWYGKMAQIVRQLKPEDYEIDEKDRNAVLTEIGTAHVEQLLGQPLRDPERPEDITPEQARLLGYLEQAMRAQFLFKRNKDYIVQGGKVVIVDEFTGRLMPGRRWSDGLHQAVEAKEGTKIEPENITYATITLQNYFRMYKKLAGMTGTALTEAEEFNKIYKLDVLPIPTNLEYQSSRANAALVEVKDRDEDGYQVVYFSKSDSPEKTPLFWRRTDYPDLVYRTVEAKLRAIATDILRSHVMGRPVLVGTTSVDNSERLSARLRAESVRRLLQIKMLRQAWFEANNKEEDGRLYAELEPLYQPLDEIKPELLRQFGKPLEVTSINPEDPANLQTLLGILRLGDEYAPRLKAIIQGGVPHEVLNARKHTEESQIIAGAGAFGAVTIATNMAGRGVDIKLGGDLAEEITIAVSRVLKRAGYDSPYDMRPEEQRQALKKLSPADYGIYDAEVRLFLQYFEDMEQVRQLGGLHVVGSERHEARRIDNQLRGRSARQGDPGSSRFYLSLEDDLMRLFGGQQVNDVMQRFKLDDDLPLENRIVSNIIEGSQHRVEGTNFDVRKHLLDYDDVLNAQRMRIYGQRDRVFTKENLHEDVLEFLKAEVENRVPAAMQDEEGPWKLLAWLEQTQPTILLADGDLFPSYTNRLLLEELDPQNLRDSLLSLARRALQAEQEHHLKAIRASVEASETALEAQITEREEMVDTFLEGLEDTEEQRRPQEILEELSGLVHMPIRLNNEQMRALNNDPASLEDPIKDQIVSQLSAVFINRMVASLSMRLGEPLTLKEDLSRLEWAEAVNRLLQLAEELFSKRYDNLAGEKGQLARELDTLLARPETQKRDESTAIRILNTLPLARRQFIDAKTRQTRMAEVSRFSYAHLASQLLAGRDADWVQADVFEHLENALEALEETWGNVEFSRLRQNAKTLADFGPAAESLGADSRNAALSDLSEEQRDTLKTELGARYLTEVFRSVLLRAITEQWVDYLTRVEALRVSIGLEAYGQRDPLVQYKTKASDMFQALLRDIRSVVVSNMFLHRPRPAVVQASEAPVEVVEKARPSEDVEQAAKSGRKRHKKR